MHEKHFPLKKKVFSWFNMQKKKLSLKKTYNKNHTRISILRVFNDRKSSRIFSQMTIKEKKVGCNVKNKNSPVQKGKKNFFFFFSEP